MEVGPQSDWLFAGALHIKGIGGCFIAALGWFGEIFFRNQRVFRALCARFKKKEKEKKEKKKAPRQKLPNRNIRDKDETLLPRSEGWRLLAALLTLSGGRKEGVEHRREGQPRPCGGHLRTFLLPNAAENFLKDTNEVDQ